jgi:hypothetical protein
VIPIVNWIVLRYASRVLKESLDAKSPPKLGKYCEIFRVIGEIGWGTYFVWVVLVAIIALVVGAIGGAIPAVRWLIQVVISPAIAVFFFRSLAVLYKGR